jgi:DNA-directed RNA polymerase subunit K/omega
MPAEFLSPEVHDVSVEPVVDPVAPRPDVRVVRRRESRSPFDSLDVVMAEAEEWDAGYRARPLHPHVGTPPLARSLVIRRPPGMGAFQFVVLSKLRAAQLMRGCRPRVDGMHKATVIAQLEVSEGKVNQAPTESNHAEPLGTINPRGETVGVAS